MERRTSLTAIAVLLMLELAVYFRYSSHTELPSPKPGPKTATVTALTKSPARHTATFEPVVSDIDERYREWSLERILAEFMVPAKDGFHASTSEEIAARLQEIYKMWGGDDLQVTVEPGALDPPISLHHENISFRSLLQLIAAVGNYDLTIDDTAITLTKRPQPAAEAIESDVVLVPPSLLMPRRLPGEDPFAEPEEFDPKRAFKHFGVVFGEGFEIELDPDDDSRWLITGDSSSVDLFRVLAERSFEAPTDVIELQPKFFEFNDGTVLEPQTFANAEETNAFIQELIASPNVTTVSYPRVVTRPGHLATIESTVTVPVPTSLDGDGNPAEFEDRSIGMFFPATPSLAGLDRIHLDAMFESAGLRDETLLEDGEIDRVLSESDFVSESTDIEGQLAAGNSALVPLRRADGTIVYQLISARRLDPVDDAIPAP